MNLFMIVMLMVAVIYAASQSHRDLLNLICEEASNVHKNLTKKQLETMVPVASRPESGLQCWKQFFCMAEKSLKTLNDTAEFHALTKLKNLIQQYNKCNPANCTLNTNISYTLHKLLEEIKTCTARFKDSNCVHMKKKAS